MAKYKITNPYSEVTDLLNNADNHYKTNLHTHSTYSDANSTMTDMIEAFYDNDFDILAFAEHGIWGKEWDEDPAIIPLFLFQNIWHGKRCHPTTQQYEAILAGTHKTAADSRTKKRGLMCVPHAIEANMFTLTKNHVNGYFTNDDLQGLCGKENDFEGPIRSFDKSGGLSHINHPTDWLQAIKNPDCAYVRENIDFFADLLRRYHSCLGIEVLNMFDIPNRSDRILWDQLLLTLLPEGHRSVWGFANSDAHDVKQVDTAFMDFILPDYSIPNLRNAMEKGNFFAVARYAKNELGEDFVGEGAYPTVTGITAENDTITVTGENCSSIEFISGGEIIVSVSTDADGKMSASLDLTTCDDIRCYVRIQLKGKGGICMTQPIICDDGDMKRFAVKSPEPKPVTAIDTIKKRFFDTRLGVICKRGIIKL